MNKALEIAKRNNLRSLIYKLGDIWKEDEKFIYVYAEEQVKANENDVEAALHCFRNLVEQKIWKKKEK